jgi:hypothetical protein
MEVRIVQFGEAATAFATIINSGSTTARGCAIAPNTREPVTFLYQTTDPATNQLTGTPNTPVDISPGGAQTFLVSVTVESHAPQTLVYMLFACTNAAPAPILPDLNTLTISAWSSRTPEILAIAVTPTHDGIVNVPPGGTATYAVAAMNIGPQTLSCNGSSPVTVDAPLYSTAYVCETDPRTGICRTPLARQMSRKFAAGEVVTFNVVIQSQSAGLPIAFDPVEHRSTIRFSDYNCFTAPATGRTSIAVRTQP